MSFIQTYTGNFVLSRDDHFISYNPIADQSQTAAICAIILGRDRSGPETAIVTRGDPRKFFILRGDFRHKYASLSSLKECIDFFLSNLDQISEWSDMPEEIKLDA